MLPELPHFALRGTGDDHARSCRESCHSRVPLPLPLRCRSAALRILPLGRAWRNRLADLHGQDLTGKIGPDQLPRLIVASAADKIQNGGEPGGKVLALWQAGVDSTVASS